MFRPNFRNRFTLGRGYGHYTGDVLTTVQLAAVTDVDEAFGGEKNSGIGRFGGEWVIDEFTTDHWISVQHVPRQYAI